MEKFSDTVKRAMIGTVGALVLGFVCLGAATAPANASTPVALVR